MAGKVAVNVVSWPTVLVAERLPRCAFIICQAMARPSPEESRDSVVASW